MLCRLLSPISYARGADVERIRITTETACCLARGAGNCAYSQPGSFALSFLQGDAKTLHLVLRADFLVLVAAHFSSSRTLATATLRPRRCWRSFITTYIVVEDGVLSESDATFYSQNEDGPNRASTFWHATQMTM